MIKTSAKKKESKPRLSNLLLSHPLLPVHLRVLLPSYLSVHPYWPMPNPILPNLPSRSKKKPNMQQSRAAFKQ